MLMSKSALGITYTMRPTLVVARYNEDLAWLQNVPYVFDIVVYNKGTKYPKSLPDSVVKMMDLPNVGKEADTYCMYILEHYDDLPEVVVFSQGNPFEHSPDFLVLLQSYDRWSGYHPLTSRYLQGIPPKDVLDSFSEDGVYVERMSCYTLGSIRFLDTGVEHLAKAYRTALHLPQGTNIIHHHLRSIGLADLVSENTETISFNYAAIFAVSSGRIRSHAPAIYANMKECLQHPGWFHPSISERIWMVLFGKQG